MAFDMWTFGKAVSEVSTPDYILEEDEDFEENEMKKYNTYESAEVFIPDDCEFSDVDGGKDDERIPIITFVDESRIPVVAEYGETSTKNSKETSNKKKKTVSYICSNCNKPYIRESSYKKHIEICNQNLKKPVVQQKTG